MRLGVRRCIVTGGSSGIGAAICLALGRKGHSVFVTGTIPQQGPGIDLRSGEVFVFTIVVCSTSMGCAGTDHSGLVRLP